MSMKRTLIRYKTKPERVEENQRLIEKVFEELRASAPDGVRYLALRLADGGFVHLTAFDAEENSSRITGLAAFRSFAGGVKERCLEPPQLNEATIVGNYRMLDE
jgi:hypothetical protein